jgi:hypothetical protein
MEFQFNCEKLLSADSEGYVLLDGKKGAGTALMSQTRGQFKVADT